MSAILEVDIYSRESGTYWSEGRSCSSDSLFQFPMSCFLFCFVFVKQGKVLEPKDAGHLSCLFGYYAISPFPLFSTQLVP